jgi:hypothetical protein
MKSTYTGTHKRRRLHERQLLWQLNHSHRITNGILRHTPIPLQARNVAILAKLDVVGDFAPRAVLARMTEKHDTYAITDFPVSFGFGLRTEGDDCADRFV